ncbi:hypothetical protein LINPERPRIM_LOCUS26847 [Linum perenne]
MNRNSGLIIHPMGELTIPCSEGLDLTEKHQ